MKATGYFDGSCRPNPGEMGIGVVIEAESQVVAEVSKECGTGTSSEAEWIALVWLLETAIKHGVDELEVRGDSQMVIKQITGAWKLKAEHLSQHLKRARVLLPSFARVRFRWVNRRKNKRADYLAAMSLKGR